jgi:hypothetical protein
MRKKISVLEQEKEQLEMRNEAVHPPDDSTASASSEEAKVLSEQIEKQRIEIDSLRVDNAAQQANLFMWLV